VRRRSLALNVGETYITKKRQSTPPSLILGARAALMNAVEAATKKSANMRFKWEKSE